MNKDNVSFLDTATKRLSKIRKIANAERYKSHGSEMPTLIKQVRKLKTEVKQRRKVVLLGD